MSSSKRKDVLQWCRHVYDSDARLFPDKRKPDVDVWMLSEDGSLTALSVRDVRVFSSDLWHTYKATTQHAHASSDDDVQTDDDKQVPRHEQCAARAAATSAAAKSHDRGLHATDFAFHMLSGKCDDIFMVFNDDDNGLPINLVATRIALDMNKFELAPVFGSNYSKALDLLPSGPAFLFRTEKLVEKEPRTTKPFPLKDLRAVWPFLFVKDPLFRTLVSKHIIHKFQQALRAAVYPQDNEALMRLVCREMGVRFHMGVSLHSHLCGTFVATALCLLFGDFFSKAESQPFVVHYPVASGEDLRLCTTYR